MRRRRAAAAAGAAAATVLAAGLGLGATFGLFGLTQPDSDVARVPTRVATVSTDAHTSATMPDD